MTDKTEVIRALSHLVATGDEADRCYASRALGSLADAAAIPVLTERLADEDVDVCVDAAEALGRLGARDAVPALLASLQNDLDGDVKTAVVDALGRIGGSEAVAALLAVVGRRPDDRLCNDGGPWDPWWDMQLKAVEALGRMAVPAAVPVLDRVLNDEDGQDIESEALKALALIGAAGEPILLRRLQEGIPRERRRAARALAYAETHSAVQALGRALLDRAPEVRAAAVEALAQAGAKPYLPAVLMLYRDPDPAVRSAAVKTATRLAAGAGATDSAVDDLVPLLSDPSSEVRTVVLHSLTAVAAKLGPEIRQQVEIAVEHDDSRVAAAACVVLGKTGDPAACTKLLAVLADSRRDPAVRGEAARALGQLGVWGEAVENALIQAVGDPAQAVRLTALNAMADLETSLGAAEPPSPGRRPIEIVVAAVGGELMQEAEEHDAAEQPSTVEEVAEPIDRASETAPAPAIRAAASTLEAIALANAEAALAVRDDASAPPEELVEEPPQKPELAPYLAIVRQNEETAERLFSKATVATPTDVRRLAARILGRTTSAAAVAALTEALHDADTVVRREAAASLAQVAKRNPTLPNLGAACSRLLEQLQSADRDLRAASAGALGALAEPVAGSALMGRLDDAVPAVRIQAIHALAALAIRHPDDDSPTDSPSEGASPATVAARLLALLGDAEPGVRKAAAQGLVALLRDSPLGGDRALIEQAVEGMAAAGFAAAGSQSRDMARALRCLNGGRAAGRLLQWLDKNPSSAERRVAIEMLEEIYR